MFFKRICTPGLSINSYLIGDEKTKRCVVIDPTRHVVPFIIQAQNMGLDITDILETHVHADYVSGAKELRHQLNEKPLIYASGMGGEQWIPTYADVIVKQGFQLKIGQLRLEAVHTPGHTPEHVIWIGYDESRSIHTPWFAFVGDCIFVGGVGRPDILGQEEMIFLLPLFYQTIFETLASLPDFLEIFPAHGEGSLCGNSLNSRSASTIGYERLFNPYFKKQLKEKWIERMKADLSPVPAYFLGLKKMNTEGPPLLSSLKVFKGLQEEQFPPFDQLFLLDIRHPELFATSHLKGSLNIPFSSSFSQWAGWLIPANHPIGLIVESAYVYSEVIDLLRLMGFDQEIWIIQWEDQQQILSFPISSFPVMEVEELAKKQTLESLYVLDVRTPAEWISGHIPWAHHLELNQLENHLKQLPLDSSIALLCKSGQRASLAASLLLKKGFSSVMNVRGGMQAWKLAGLPLKVEDSKIKKF